MKWKLSNGKCISTMHDFWSCIFNFSLSFCLSLSLSICMYTCYKCVGSYGDHQKLLVPCSEAGVTVIFELLDMVLVEDQQVLWTSESFSSPMLRWFKFWLCFFSFILFLKVSFNITWLSCNLLCRPGLLRTYGELFASAY